MDTNKAWMYNRVVNGFITKEYCDGVEEFVNFAKRHPKCMDDDKLRCPCNHCKCRNTTFRDEVNVKVHLGKNGFVPNYYNWYCHGEPYLYEPIKHSTASSSAPVASSKAIDYDMITGVAQASQPAIKDKDPKTLSYDVINDIYYDVVGGAKKNSIYGLGSQSKVIFNRQLCTPKLRGRPSSSSAEEQALRKENEELKARITTLEQLCTPSPQGCPSSLFAKVQALRVENEELKDRMTTLEQSMQEFISRFEFSRSSASPAFPDYSAHGFDSQETQNPRAPNE